MRRIVASTAIVAVLLGLLAAGATAATTTVIVAPGSMNGWAFAQDPAVGGTAGGWQLETGPGAPPAGIGSAELTALLTTDRPVLGTTLYNGLALADITELQYSTYRDSPAGGVLALALQFNIDADLTDVNTSFQGRLVYEPYYTKTVSSGQWQTWDTLDDDGAGPSTNGNWWFSDSGLATASGCGIATPCAWSEILAAYPDAGVHATLGATLFKAGGGWTGFVGNVDRFSIGTGSDTTTFDFEPGSFGPCAASVSGTTITLLSDCTTTETIEVPNGFTLDGDGYTITAEDPSGGHFTGGVVENGGAVAHVTDLEITASGLADVCDAGADRLRGILFDGARGSITYVDVNGVRQGLSGCQEGNAIEVRNFDTLAATQLAVTISDNDVSDYQKNGITANGNVAATITRNTVTGDGPVSYIAQNGIQIGFGATAQIRQNEVSGNAYTPTSFVACGLLFVEASGVRQQANDLFANERNLCNFGRGGGTFNPAP